MSWNGAPITAAELRPRLQAQAQAHPGNLPELRIATDEGSQYEALVKVLAAADATGMKRIALLR